MGIKSLRTSSGMTQAAFAELLGIPIRTIEDWESGRRKPPEYVVRLIEYRIKHKEAED